MENKKKQPQKILAKSILIASIIFSIFTFLAGFTPPEKLGLFISYKSHHLCFQYVGDRADRISFQLIDDNGKARIDLNLSFSPGEKMGSTLRDIEPGVYYFHSEGTYTPKNIQKIHIPDLTAC